MGDESKIARIRAQAARAGWILLVLTAASSCAGNNGKSVLTTCVLPSDQSATLEGRWTTTPVPIALSSTSGFSTAETSAIAAAAQTWNTFYGASLNMAAIDPGSGGVRSSGAVHPSSVCSQSILQSGAFTGSVVIYKEPTWDHTDQPAAIALTSFCTGTNTASTATNPYNLAPFYMAIVELNYQSFFVAGAKQPDLQSILTHELGHVMGLKHSCETSSSIAGMPNCSSSSLASDYSAASMYPVFSFDSSGNGQVKRDLLTNDQERANCLYQGGTVTN